MAFRCPSSSLWASRRASPAAAVARVPVSSPISNKVTGYFFMVEKHRAAFAGAQMAMFPLISRRGAPLDTGAAGGIDAVAYAAVEGQV